MLLLLAPLLLLLATEVVLSAFLSVTSTLARATPIAGTTHFPQLHRNPCQANLPTLASHLGFGHVSRPDSGASSVAVPVSPPASEDEGEAVEVAGPGNRQGRIHVRGWRNMCAQSRLSVDGLVDFLVSWSWGLMKGVVASMRLFINSKGVNFQVKVW